MVRHSTLYYIILHYYCRLTTYNKSHFSTDSSPLNLMELNTWSSTIENARQSYPGNNYNKIPSFPPLKNVRQLYPGNNYNKIQGAVHYKALNIVNKLTITPITNMLMSIQQGHDGSQFHLLECTSSYSDKPIRFC